MMDDPNALSGICAGARDAATSLAQTDTQVKNLALLAAADGLESAVAAIFRPNAADVDAQTAGTSKTLLDRLRLTEGRIASMAAGLRAIAALPDPVGELIENWTRPNGLEIRQVRVPVGVVAVIYEARPNVTTDVVGLCLKSGNSAILRGSVSARRSNRAIVDAIRPALAAAGLHRHVVQLLDDDNRAAARALMRMRSQIDLLVPRGGPALIADVIEHATVPYVIDGDGNCHVYVDRAADLAMAERIVINAKVSRPSVCNSAEKLMVHEEVAPAFLPAITKSLKNHGVALRGDARARELIPWLEPATESDWPREYLDLIMAIKVVDGVDEAVDHIRKYGSGHTEAIVTADAGAARAFVSACPSAVVMVNASTRFTDGWEFGFGAEIGNSTQRLHARGPMGLRELTTYRYEVWGDGQVRQ